MARSGRPAGLAIAFDEFGRRVPGVLPASRSRLMDSAGGIVDRVGRWDKMPACEIIA